MPLIFLKLSGDLKEKATQPDKAEIPTGAKSVSWCEVPESVCDKQDEQGTEHYDGDV